MTVTDIWNQRVFDRLRQFHGRDITDSVKAEIVDAIIDEANHFQLTDAERRWIKRMTMRWPHPKTF